MSLFFSKHVLYKKSNTTKDVSYEESEGGITFEVFAWSI